MNYKQKILHNVLLNVMNKIHINMKYNKMTMFALIKLHVISILQMVMKKLVHKIVNLLKVKNKFKIMFVLLLVIQQLINILMEKYVYNHA